MSIYLGNTKIFNPQAIISRNIEQENLFINREISTYINSKVTRVRNNAFAYCSSLQSINLSNASYIGYFAFDYCYNLLSLYLGSASICSLAGSNAFRNTPISDYTASTGGVYGSIFVPASLYSDYITATNWAAFSSRFVSI